MAQKHDEKLTFYCTSDEAIQIDEAILQLRKLGVKVDRGLVIRTALALALDGLLADAKQSSIFRALAPLPEYRGIPDPALFA